MDVVYLCRPGDNPELRYSLRSLRNLQHDDVWIYGAMPSWVHGVRYFGTAHWGNKHAITNRNLRAAIANPAISDPFILMNDDFYVMRPVKNLRPQHMGTIRDVIARYEKQDIESDYVAGMRRTLARLEQLGYADPFSYELHTPLIVHKAPMEKALKLGPYQRRSVYGAFAGLGGKKTQDVKVSRVGAPIRKTMFLSSSDATFPYLRPTLDAAFPTPSRFERR